MITTRVRRRARRCLVGAALVLCALVAASCQAILGTQGYQGSADALCELLEGCYADGIAGCKEAVGDALTKTTPALRTFYLGEFSDRACLESCASARRCLDIVPVCGDDTCAKREDCCGFTQGTTDCNLDTQRCCARPGARCDTPEDCCIETDDCIDNVCGGVPCSLAGTPCSIGAQCCSGVCRDKVCAEESCFEDGFNCTADEDCCNDLCNAQKKCGKPACSDESAPCNDIDKLCCDGLVCRGGTCSRTDCSSEGVDCADSDKCCGKRCDLQLHVCIQCLGSGAACAASGDCCNGSCVDGLCDDCLANGDACVSGDECCSMFCDSDTNTCAPSCGKVACSHSACAAGTPLPKDGCSTCVTQVCAEDPFCCCKAWDSVCVSEAMALCSDPCAPLP